MSLTFFRRSKTEESEDRSSIPRSSKHQHQEGLQRGRHHHQYGSQPEVYRSSLQGSKPEFHRSKPDVHGSRPELQRSQPLNGAQGNVRGCETYYGSSYKLYGGSQTNINNHNQLRTGTESNTKCTLKFIDGNSFFV